MLQNFKDTFIKRLNNLRWTLRIISLIVPLSYVLYLVFAMIDGRGSLAVNIILCVATVAYEIFRAVTDASKNKELKRAGRMSKRALKRLKLAATALNLFTLIYSITLASAEVTFLSVLWVILNAIILAVRIILECIVSYIERKLERLCGGIKAGFEKLLSPILHKNEE